MKERFVMRIYLQIANEGEIAIASEWLNFKLLVLYSKAL